MRKHFAFLDYLQSISPKRQKVLIKAVDPELIDCFSEIALNLVQKNVPLTKKQLSRLKPYEKSVYELSLKKNSQKNKKKLIQRGGLLTALLGTVLPVLISTILSATAKKSNKNG